MTAVDSATQVSNVLDYMDEGFFRDFKAQGHATMIQFIWVYERDVDLTALRRFHRNLGFGLLGRCIERSPIPFGRSRWVAWEPPADFEIVKAARPRSELIEWTDEQAALPIDLEKGPPWRLAVQPLAEGGSAVSLLVAHAIADGVGLNNAVADAVNGVGKAIGYPSAHAQTRSHAVLSDLRQLLRDVPGMLKALVFLPLSAKAVPMRKRASAGTALTRRLGGSPPAVRVPITDLDVANPQRGRLPSVTVLVDTEHWDEIAESLGGRSNSLFIGFSTKLCEILGWLDKDGLADIVIPVNERHPGDTRGNALTSASITVDPTTATDLRAIRGAVKAALVRLAENRSRIMAPIALTPLLPVPLANRLQTVLQKSANVTCSHFGDLDPAVNRPDGTDADMFYARHARTPDMADPALLRRAGGIFFPIASGRLGGRLYASICYSDADGTTTVEQLVVAVRRALDEFGLRAFIEGEPSNFPPPE